MNEAETDGTAPESDDLTLADMAGMADAAFGDDDDEVFVVADPFAHPHWCKCQRVCGGDQ